MFSNLINLLDNIFTDSKVLLIQLIKFGSLKLRIADSGDLMTFAHWSLDKLFVLVVGFLFLSLGILLGGYATVRFIRTIDQALIERGQLIAELLTSEITSDHNLLDSPGSLRATLMRAHGANRELRYLAVVESSGAVLAHTFSDVIPATLESSWRESEEIAQLIKLDGEELSNIQETLTGTNSASLHIGISRTRVVEEKNQAIRIMFLQFLLGGGLLFGALHFIAAKIAWPLRRLEGIVSRFPDQQPLADLSEIGGTREIRALARSFAGMVKRVDGLEEERQSTQMHMIHAERLAVLGEVAAGLAHEIHNPLDGMQECLRYLQESDGQSKKAKKYYPMMQDGLERIRRTMHEMLNFARSGQDVRLQSIRVKEVLDSVSLLVEQQLQGRHVHLSWSKLATCVCLCDKHALTQACLNLILNAAEAAEQGRSPEVRVGAVCDSRWVYITVEDSGSGIDPSLASKIFEPFFTTKEAGKGTGLGLSVSRELIWASNGELLLDQTPGALSGAKFTIKLRKCCSAMESCDK